MRFAKIVFLIAGLWGFLVLTPLYFLYDYIGSQYPPAITHPDFYYGFLSVTFAWQVAFLVISRDPVRYRTLMVPAMLEKFVYIVTLVVLYARGQLVVGQIVPGLPDCILGTLFVAFFKTAGAPKR